MGEGRFRAAGATRQLTFVLIPGRERGALSLWPEPDGAGASRVLLAVFCLYDHSNTVSLVA